MLGQKSLEPRTSALIHLHYVETCRAVHVNVDEAGRNNAIGKVGGLEIWRQAGGVARFYPADNPVLNDHHGIADHRCWRTQRLRSKGDHRKSKSRIQPSHADGKAQSTNRTA